MIPWGPSHSNHQDGGFFCCLLLLFVVSLCFLKRTQSLVGYRRGTWIWGEVGEGRIWSTTLYELLKELIKSTEFMYHLFISRICINLYRLFSVKKNYSNINYLEFLYDLRKIQRKLMYVQWTQNVFQIFCIWEDLKLRIQRLQKSNCNHV